MSESASRRTRRQRRLFWRIISAGKTNIDKTRLNALIGKHPKLTHHAASRPANRLQNGQHGQQRVLPSSIAIFATIARQTIGQTIGQVIGQTIGQTIGQAIGQTIDRSSSSRTSHSNNNNHNKTVNASLAHPRPCHEHLGCSVTRRLMHCSQQQANCLHAPHSSS